MGKYIVAVRGVAKAHFGSFDEAKWHAETLVDDCEDIRIDWLTTETLQPTPSTTYRLDPKTGNWAQTTA